MSGAVITNAVDSAPSVEVADLGFGLQIVSLSGNGRTWYFAAKEQFAIQKYNQAGGTIGTYVLPSYFDVQVVTYPTARSVRLSFTKTGEADSFVTIDGVLNDPDGSLDLTRTFGLDDTAFTGIGAWDFAWRLPVKPYEIPTASDMFAQLPAWGGTTYRNATNVQLGPPTADYPGFLPNIWPTVVSGGPAGHQLCCTWHGSSKSCLAIRTNSTAGHGIRFSYQGDGDNVVFQIIEFPDDHLVSHGDSSKYTLTLRPMPGDWYDAAVWYRERIVAEQAPFIARGKITTSNGYSIVWRDGSMHIIMVPGGGVPITLQSNDPAVWARAVEEIIRIRNYYGTDLKYTVQWYTWHDNANDKWPDFHPPLTQFMVALGQVAAISANIQQTVYVFPTPIDPDSAFAVANPTILDNVILDPDQSPRQDTTTLVSPHDLVQMGSSAARTLLVNHWKTLTTSVPPIIGVYYDDTSGNTRGPDYRSTLAASQRGPGSSYFEGGKILWLAAMQNEFRTVQGRTAWLQIGEWNSETTLPYFESQGSIASFAISPSPTTDLFLPSYATVYSQWIGQFSFNDMLAGEVPTLIWDLTLWQLERQFHFGARSGAAWFGNMAQPHIVEEDADAHASLASFVIPYQRPALTFHRNLVRSLNDLNVRKYVRGKRLRPLPDSHESLILSRGYDVKAEQVYAAGDVIAVAKYADVQSSVWCSDELGSVGILLTNHHLEARTIRIRMTPEDYPEIAGLPYISQNLGGLVGRQLLRSGPGYIDVTVSVPALSAAVYEVTSTKP